MSIEKIMSINVNTLSEMQFRELKQFTTDRLNKITRLIAQEQFDEVYEFLAGSPAGDGYGAENTYIDFGIPKTNMEDIGDVIDKLKELKHKIGQETL